MMRVVSVAARAGHGLGKTVCPEIRLVAGEGVTGDAHCGVTVQHLSRVAKDPSLPNLRQVHLIHAELLADLATRGFFINPGALGENILTSGLDLLGLQTGAKLAFPSGARLTITGLRNPCHQINGHTPGLMQALLDQAEDGALIRKGGVMAVVEVGGLVRAGDRIDLVLPSGAFRPLEPV